MNKNTRGRGRPKKEFDADTWKKIDGLCHIQCTRDEICEVMGFGEDVLNRNCKRVYRKTFRQYRADRAKAGKMSLRRSMWNKAISDSNPTMQIWLSKNYLGMKDREEITGDLSKHITIDFLADLDDKEQDATGPEDTPE